MTIKNFFIFIYNKIIGDDIETVKYMIKQKKEGKPILDPKKKRIAIQEMKKLPKVLFKESWYWILAIIFVFCMGYLVGLEKCEVECNNYIVANYRECMTDSNDLPIIFPNISIFPSNPSKKDSYKYDYSID